MVTAPLIDEYLPDFDVAAARVVWVDAAPERVRAVLRVVDLGADPVVLALLTARALPALPRLLLRRLRGERGATIPRLRLDDLERAGFVLLGERWVGIGERRRSEQPALQAEGATGPCGEVLFGLVGRFWMPGGGIVRVAPPDFVAFDALGYAKVAWNFTVRSAGGGTIIGTETRVKATDERSRRRFRRYWRLVGPFSGLIRTRIVAALERHTRLGSQAQWTDAGRDESPNG